MTEIITSKDNNRVKLVYSLQNRPRGRRKERKIALEGSRLIKDALAAGQKPFFVLYDDTADFDLIARLQNVKRTEVIAVDSSIIQHLSDTQQPQGMVAVFAIPNPPMPRKAGRILILDTVRDPGNMGTILRTAAAAGIDAVVLGPECVDPYNPKVIRSGMGAHFRVPIFEAGWDEISALVEELDVYVATGDGDTTYTDIDWTRRWALIIGNEAHGVSDEAIALLEGKRVAIPMAAQTESINAAVATGVILFEAQRQHRIKAQAE